MKYIFLFFYVFIGISCSTEKAKQESNPTVKDDYFEDNNDTIIIIDSICLSELIPKTDILRRIINLSIDLIRDEKKYQELKNFNCIIASIQYREDFKDTLCWINPQMQEDILFFEHSMVGFAGFFYWTSLPVFVHSNCVTSFFNTGQTQKIFRSGTPICDGIYECPRFRIQGDSFIQLDSNYP